MILLLKGFFIHPLGQVCSCACACVRVRSQECASVSVCVCVSVRVCICVCVFYSRIDAIEIAPDANMVYSRDVSNVVDVVCKIKYPLTFYSYVAAK